MRVRPFRKDEVRFTLTVEPEHIRVRGNLMASGDDEADKAAEDEVIARLDRGDEWAWCTVMVTASVELPDGKTLSGIATLGGCSYDSEADFKRDGYYEEMQREATDDLRRNIEADILEGETLANYFSEEG